MVWCGGCDFYLVWCVFYFDEVCELVVFGFVCVDWECCVIVFVWMCDVILVVVE